MKKIKETELYKGVQLKSRGLDSEVPSHFEELEIVENKFDYVVVKSISHPQFQGKWCKKFLINRGYYKMK